jgi:hypothetical protein
MVAKPWFMRQIKREPVEGGWTFKGAAQDSVDSSFCIVDVMNFARLNVAPLNRVLRSIDFFFFCIEYYDFARYK